MKKIGKMKVLLSVLLVTLCVAGVASVNHFVKEKDTEQGTASVMTGGLTFNNVPLRLQVGGTGTVTTNIPLGYDSLRVEPNEYCLTYVREGGVIMVTAMKSTEGSATTIRVTAFPLSTTRGLRDISGEFTVYVTGK